MPGWVGCAASLAPAGRVTSSVGAVAGSGPALAMAMAALTTCPAFVGSGVTVTEFTLRSALKAAPTTKQGENSDVLPFPSVAVAVKIWPFETPPETESVQFVFPDTAVTGALLPMYAPPCLVASVGVALVDVDVVMTSGTVLTVPA